MYPCAGICMHIQMHLCMYAGCHMSAVSYMMCSLLCHYSVLGVVVFEYCMVSPLVSM